MKAMGLAGLALLLSVDAAVAETVGTHLEPEMPDWVAATYAYNDAHIVVAVFKDAFDKDVLLRMRVSYAYGGPFDGVVALAKRQGAYEIVYLHTSAGLFRYTEAALEWDRRDHMKPPVPADYHAIKPDHCRIALPSQTAADIVSIWRAVLLQTRYDTEPRRGMDGAWFQFAMVDEKWGQLAGIIWSPDSDTLPGKLADVGSVMMHYCEGRTPELLNQLQSDVASLRTNLRHTRN